MGKKILILFILAMSSFVILPAETRAETVRDSFVSGAGLTPVSLFQRGRGRGRGNRNWRAWRRGDNRYNNTNSRRRARFIRQTYWRNGRRYVRVVRVY